MRRAQRTRRTQRSPVVLAALGAAMLCAGCRGRDASASSPEAPAIAGPARDVAQKPVPAAVTCQRASPASPGESRQVVVSGGIERPLVLVVPEQLDRARPAPLVFSLHGSGGAPDKHLAGTRLGEAARRYGFVLVLPAAVDAKWNVPVDRARADDVRFASDLIDAIDQQVCIDRRRVYAVGFSGGGRMASQLACDLSDRIAAIAAVGGIRFPGPCTSARPIPILAIHGTGDTTNPYDGGGEPHWGTGVEAAIDGWRKHHHCSRRSERSLAARVTQIAYDDCVPVILDRIDELEHRWPHDVSFGAGSSTGEPPPTVNDVIWTFFVAHTST